MKVTASHGSVASSLFVYPVGGSRPARASLSWTKAATATRTFVVAVGTHGQIDLVVQGGSVDVTLAAVGYHRRATGLVLGSTNAPTASTALVTGAGGVGGRLVGPGRTLAVSVAGHDGIASNASCVVLSVTVEYPTSSSSLTVYPAGHPRPSTSALSWRASQVTSSTVIVALGHGGVIDLYNRAGSAQIIVSVEGVCTS